MLLTSPRTLHLASWLFHVRRFLTETKGHAFCHELWEVLLLQGTTLFSESFDPVLELSDQYAASPAALASQNKTPVFSASPYN